MEHQDHETKHVCKFCNSSFLSAQILGGHMKNHLGRRNSDKEKVKKLDETCDLGIEEEGYGLRENPKKSWKSSGFNRTDTDDTVITLQENVKCSVCGKQFGSPRSLHGHMRHHSVEERNGVRCKECGKGFRSLRSLTGHMRLHSGKQKIAGESRGNHNLISMSLTDSDTTVSLVRKKKRSNRMRYKANSTPNSCVSSLNECSLNESVCEFEIEPDVEEVAMSLMLLSRGLYELGEFSGGDEFGGKKGIFESCKKMFECSDCNEEIKVECEVPGLIDESEESHDFTEFDEDEDMKKRNEFECRICKKKFLTYQALGGHQTFHRTRSFVSMKIQPILPEKTDQTSKLECKEDDGMEGEEVRKEHKCHICCKNFESGQALGGHKRAHIAKMKEDRGVWGGSNGEEDGFGSWWDGGGGGGGSYNNKQESVLVVDVMVKANKNAAVISF